MKDVPTKLSIEGFKKCMVRKSELVNMKDLPAKLSEEDFTSGMMQRDELTAKKDEATMLFREESPVWEYHWFLNLDGKESHTVL